MKSRSIFIIGTFSIISFIGLAILNTKSITERNLNYLRESEKENSESFQGVVEYNRLLKADLTTGYINPEYVKVAYQQLNNMSKSRAGFNLTWDFRGPDNIGGRTRTLIVDNKNPKILYAGGVAGGIFKSIDGGESWVRKTYTADIGGLIINCGAQAINGDLYFGTGEQIFCKSGIGDLNSGNQGGGIYKSTDRGEHWARLSYTDPTVSRWQNIQGIAVNPTDSNVIYAATQGGLTHSTNGGQTWALFTNSTGSQIGSDIKISPDGKTIFFATYSMGGCRVYRSKWNSTTSKYDNLSQIGVADISLYTIRLCIAIAPSNPDYIYVSAASNGAGAGGYSREALEGIYRSKDNGDTWTKIVTGATAAEPFGNAGSYQGSYDHCIAIDPYNPMRFFLGGVDFYMYDEPFWYKGASTSEYLDDKQLYINPYYIHADKHNITFDTVSKPYKMYVVTDGGVSISKDAQYKKYPTFKTININYSTSQFYAVAASRYDDIIGGTQDNGTFRIENNSFSGKNGKEILGNDGFCTEISRYDPNIFITEYQYGAIHRSRDRGVNIQKLKVGKIKDLNTFPFNSPFRIWEDLVDSYYIDSSQINPKIDTTIAISKLFFAGQNEVWLNLDAHDFARDADKWFLITTSNFQVYPMCMEYTKDGNTLYVGGKDASGGSGVLYRITGMKNAKYIYNANENFDPTAQGIKTELIKSFPGVTVTGIGISPGDNNNMVVTLGNYVGSAVPHVYITKNALAAVPTFVPIQGNLPGMPVYDAAIHSLGSGTDTIIITTEFGVFTTIHGGTDWFETNTGMDRVPSYMIRQVQAQPWHNGFYYYIATHGYGIFSTSFGDNMSIPDKSKFIRPEISVYPNPAVNSSNVSIKLTKTSDVIIQVFDLNGRTLQTYNFKQAKPGMNSFPLNTSTFKSGTYFVRARVEGQYITSKLMISK